MNITQCQRITLMKIWHRVCKDRHWVAGDRALRLATWSKILGRPLTSSNDVGRIAECTRLMNELKVLLGVSLRTGLEAADPGINDARVLRYQIVNELVPCLELYINDSVAYITSIMADKNRWWKIDRPLRSITLDDLDAHPTIRRDGTPGPSQLQQLQWTLAARVNTLRKAAGHSVHDMRIKASLRCSCCRCVKNPLSIQPQVSETRNTLQDEPFDVSAAEPF